MSLDVQIFEWPERFFVEASSPDREYYQFWPRAHVEVTPHFVDLGIYDTGFCSCRDFEINIEPYLTWNDTNRRECKHIKAAQSFRSQFEIKPTPMPLTIW